MSDDGLDPMSIEGLDARLVNVETILPDLFDMYKLRAGLAGCRDRSEHREPHAGPTIFTVSGEYLLYVDTNSPSPSGSRPHCNVEFDTSPGSSLGQSGERPADLHLRGDLEFVE